MVPLIVVTFRKYNPDGKAETGIVSTVLFPGVVKTCLPEWSRRRISVMQVEAFMVTLSFAGFGKIIR
jgi:hypothetical protein